MAQCCPQCGYKFPRKVAGLSAKQREIYDFIAAFIREHSYSPSYDEICEAMDIQSKSGVHFHLRTLRERGWIDTIPGHARSISIREVPQ